jgi:hypothetical protein
MRLPLFDVFYFIRRIDAFTGSESTQILAPDLALPPPAPYRACQHSGTVAFDAINLPEEAPFPEIGRARRFRCTACGSRDYAVVPDWRGYRAPGMGKI